MSVFNNFGNRQAQARNLEYSVFIQKVRQHEVEAVTLKGTTAEGSEITGRLKNGGEQFKTYSPGDPKLVEELINNGVNFEAKPNEGQSLLLTIFINWFPLLLLVGVWIFFMRQMQGGEIGR